MSEQQTTTSQTQPAESGTGGAEERARRMGWVPQEDFRGDPEKWVDAEQFVERAHTELPIMRENLKRMERKLAQQEKVLADFREFASKSEERAFQRALEQIKTEQRQAVEDGDVARFDAAQKRFEALSKEIPAAPAAPIDSAVQAEFAEWHSKNEWYTRDPEMTVFADAAGDYLAKIKPHLKGTPKFLEEVEKRVRREFPDRFENAKRREPGAVHGAGDESDGAPARRGKTYADLPADAKAMCDRFVKTIPGYTREDYVRDYNWS